nr:immunoglobulin light chain junction region [Macaca mulatta]MOX51659.1 immunoglobulin light chain junction region [Macaca mulatta]MOX51778.1 immunoglobulin light chain junction region [Macaca mulatta]MOX52249.1 immunoglobulin light chain junction region [Macaca mulatta]MOX52602.1 immunoglobulin light chain junction region [Macaca mulatta]
CMQYTHIPPTF